MKKLLALFLSAVFVLSFAACSQETSGSSSESSEEASQSSGESQAVSTEKDDGEPVALELMWCEITDDLDAAWQTLFEEFNKDNPNITVNFNPTSNSSDTIRVQVAAGAGADMVQLDAFDVAAYAQEDFIVNLNDLAAANSWEGTLYDWAYNCCSYNGGLYALPWSYEMTCMQYNSKLLEEYDMEVPTTRAEFEAFCERAKEIGISPLAYGGLSSSPLYNQWIIDHYINAVSGADLLVAVCEGEKAWDCAEMVEAMNVLVSDFEKGYYSNGLSSSITLDEGKSQFLSGQAFLYPEGTAFALNITDEEAENDNFSLGLALWPSMSDGLDGTGSYAAGEVIAINANTQNQAACETVLEWLMTDDEAVCAAIAGGVSPPCRDVDYTLMPDNTLIGVERAMEAISTFDNSTNNSYAPWSFYPSTCNQYLYENLDKIVMGTITVEEYLGTAQSRYEDDVSDGYIFAG